MNSKLYDKVYMLPSNVLTKIQTALASTPHGNGVKRAKFLLNNGQITYQDMKRIKHDLEEDHDQYSQEYNLAGGDDMLAFINRELTQDRDTVERSTEVRRDFTNNMTQDVRPDKLPKINEGFDDGDEELKKNALAIIVNDDDQILLLKRGNHPEIWQPGKWALVGGGVEEGEEPVRACQREVKEETGLDIGRFSHKYIIQRNPDSVEHIFICKHNGDDYDIELDTSENDQYGCYSPEEIKFLDHVPNLVEYINLAFKKYD